MFTLLGCDYEVGWLHIPISVIIIIMYALHVWMDVGTRDTGTFVVGVF